LYGRLLSKDHAVAVCASSVGPWGVQKSRHGG
jgi:hypothetical protein